MIISSSMILAIKINLKILAISCRHSYDDFTSTLVFCLC